MRLSLNINNKTTKLNSRKKNNEQIFWAGDYTDQYNNC